MNKEMFKRACKDRGFKTTYHKDGRITITKTKHYRRFNTVVNQVAKEVRYLQQLLKDDGYAIVKGERKVNENMYTAKVTFSNGREE